MTSKQHTLKIHPQPLADLLSGAKTCEIRFNDRGFQVGDTVRLMEVNPETGNWTGAADHVRTISHIQTGYGLPDGMCVLSYAQPAAGEPVEIEVPTFSYEGMGCGLEDRGITERYEAMEYGYTEALEQQWEIIKSYGPLYAAPPAAAHGASEFFVDFDTLRKALTIYGLAAPVSNEELGLQMERQAVRVIEAVAKMPFPTSAAAHGDELYTAQARLSEALSLLRKVDENGEGLYRSLHEDIQSFLAGHPAAHGDEAVRKILEAFPLLGDAGLDHETHHCEWSIQQERKRLHKLLSAMRAQAGEGGE